MEKRVLGRGLDILMRGQSPVRETTGAPEPEATGGAEPSDHAEKFGRGMETLLNGARTAELTEPIKTRLTVTRPEVEVGIPSFYWYALDVILLSIAGSVVWFGQEPVTWGRGVFAAAAVGFGCWAGILGVRQTVASNRGAAPGEWVAFSANTNGSTKRYLLHCAEPLFIGEVVGGTEGEPEVAPLWIAPSGDNPARAVEQLITELRQIAEVPPAPSNRSANLRSVLVRLD